MDEQLERLMWLADDCDTPRWQLRAFAEVIQLHYDLTPRGATNEDSSH